jgi:hypothetical protein
MAANPEARKQRISRLGRHGERILNRLDLRLPPGMVTLALSERLTVLGGPDSGWWSLRIPLATSVERLVPEMSALNVASVPVPSRVPLMAILANATGRR